jgi:hypothetical protein
MKRHLTSYLFIVFPGLGEGVGAREVDEEPESIRKPPAAAGKYIHSHCYSLFAYCSVPHLLSYSPFLYKSLKSWVIQYILSLYFQLTRSIYIYIEGICCWYIFCGEKQICCFHLLLRYMLVIY